MIKVNDKQITPTYFPDGTPLLIVDKAIYTQMDDAIEQNKNNIVTITWKYDNDAEFLQLNFVLNHLRTRGIHNINLYMPYIPNARFDRVKNEDEVFTLKYFANLINDMQFSNVIVLDPHSYVSEALINNLHVLEPTAYVEKVLEEIPDHDNLLLYFPDEGAMKRYSGIANRLHLPFAFGIKNRDWRNGNIIETTVAGLTCDPAGRQVLMIDDICSKGGTFYYNAKALKELNVGDIYLYISHCENAIMQGDLIYSDLVKHIFTTDSIYRENNPLITVLPC